MKSSKISVVIPTYNSMLALKETLDSFKAQSLSIDAFEVIVVDDGSKDGSKYLVDEYRKCLDISYYYLEDKGFRLAAARNMGIHFAKYPIVLMFDCGMLASSSLLDCHLKMHNDFDDAVVIGMSYGVEEFSMVNAEAITKILEENTLEGAFSLLKKSELYNDCRYNTFKSRDFDLSDALAPWAICWGGHVSCKTQTLRELNGFDEWFNAWGGEDVELAIRFHIRGCSFQVLRSMEAIHIPHYRSEEDIIRSSQTNIKYIVSKHNHPKVDLLEKFGWEYIFQSTT